MPDEAVLAVLSGKNEGIVFSDICHSTVRNDLLESLLHKRAEDDEVVVIILACEQGLDLHS